MSLDVKVPEPESQKADSLKWLNCNDPKFLALLRLWNYVYWDWEEVFPPTLLNLVKLARKRWDVRPFIKKGEHLVKLNKTYELMGTTEWRGSNRTGKIWFLRDEGHVYLEALVGGPKYNARGWTVTEEEQARKKSQPLLLIFQGEKIMKIRPTRQSKPITDRRVARLFFESLIHPQWKDTDETEDTSQSPDAVQRLPLITLEEKHPTRINLKEDLDRISRFTGYIRCLYPGDEWEILRFQNLRPLKPDAAEWPLNARRPHIRLGVALILQNLDASKPRSSKMAALEAAILKYLPWLYRREDLIQIKDVINDSYLLLIKTPLVNVLKTGYAPHYVAVCMDCLSSRCGHVFMLQKDAYLSYPPQKGRKKSRKLETDSLKIGFNSDRYRIVDELNKIPFFVDESSLPPEEEEEEFEELGPLDEEPEEQEEDLLKEDILQKQKAWDI